MSNDVPESDPITPSPQTGKRIVIFADGTGSAFGRQESNVWRLYQTLDKTDKQGALLQLARYIPGVGTSANAVVRMLDGAIGFGVPSNVRKLYRFVCWNWEPGDQIYLFGFSRGAFTVRTLAGMIAMQGLMPGGAEVSQAEMARNARGAWRAYREETAPLIKDGVMQMNPLIGLVRVLRNGLVAVKRGLLGQRGHREVLEALPQDRRAGAVPIRFMGLFDTVEAYGLPVEEMRGLWNWLIWPIRFRNRRCSPVVQHVRHGLSLDDERLSFHPIRFDQSPRPDGRPVPDTKEVWFAGVHSDVGGGYPNDETAFAPLLWIADEASFAGLIFDRGALERFRRRLYPQALIHDSRRGLASIYRYSPRLIESGESHGGAPVVHPSVLAKMRNGADGYAPLRLPAGFCIAAPDPQGTATVCTAVGRDETVVRRIEALIHRRKGTNWTTILAVMALIVIPLWDFWKGSAPPQSDTLRWIAGLVGGLLPGWAVTWAEGLVARWYLTLPLLALIVAIYRVNDVLALRIRDLARRIWR